MQSTIDKLDAIHRQHESDNEACLNAVIEAFLRGEGVSWRRVIHALYEAEENHIAHDIIAYAEPVQGECVCYDCGFQTNHHSAKFNSTPIYLFLFSILHWLTLWYLTYPLPSICIENFLCSYIHVNKSIQG